MSKLLEQYNNMSQDDKERIGKVSARIKNPGCHLVSIVEAAEIDGNRIKVDFKTDAGETADWTGFLETKDASGAMVPNQHTMSQFTFICKAAGLTLQQALGQTKEVTKSFKKGDVTAEVFTGLTKKKLYITTTTVLEGDDKNPDRCYVKQEVNPFKFFDTKKRTTLEIDSKAAEGTTMEATDAEAKETIEIGYKWQGNAACEKKYAELQEKLNAKTVGASTGVIGGGSAAVANEDPDDI